MSLKSILVADPDPRVAAQLSDALGADWVVQGVVTGNAALAALDAQRFDAVAASLDLPEVDGPTLLNRIRQSAPDTGRFLLAEENDREEVLKKGLGTQQILSKPCDAAEARRVVEHYLAADKWIADETMRDLVSRIRSLPTIPSIYTEVRAALRSPDATTMSVASIINKDMAMTTKLLQVCNSSYFGLRRKITDAEEAVGLLGFNTVNSIVVAVKMLGYYDRIKPAYFTVDRLWRHSLAVAQHARKLALRETGDEGLAETAHTAGLMHDLGKVVLACNFCQQYEETQKRAKREARPLWQIEKEVFGANHADIGAYLLGLWGLPAEVSEAAALHHQPMRSSAENFAPLTAVHIANAIEHEINPSHDGTVASTVDTIYLARIGCLKPIAEWRDEILGVKTETVPPPPMPAPVANSMPLAPARTETLRASWIQSVLRWIAAMWNGERKPAN